MNKLVYISAILLFSTLFSACTNDSEDVSKPVINLIEPEDGHALKIGAAVHFEMELSDDTELRSYKVDIHNNFDGHNHTKAVSETVGCFGIEKYTGTSSRNCYPGKCNSR